MMYMATLRNLKMGSIDCWPNKSQVLPEILHFHSDTADARYPPPVNGMYVV